VVPVPSKLEVKNKGASAAPTTLYIIPTVDLSLLPALGTVDPSPKAPRLGR
jgi:hypothetical protein